MTDKPVIESVEAGETGTTLLGRIKNKDPDGWERFVHLYSPLIFRWCRQSGLSETDAADVGQEVFQAVLRGIANFRRERPGDTFRGWLRTIVQNKLRDRKRQLIPGGIGVGGEAETLTYLNAAAPADLPELDDSALDDELMLMRRAVDMVLVDYDDNTRQAFLRVVAGEEEPAAVAVALGMTVNMIYLAKSRIKRQIREEFEGLLETT